MIIFSGLGKKNVETIIVTRRILTLRQLINGQFFVFLPGWFVHFLAHFGNVKKPIKEIGSEKKCSTVPVWQRGSLKLFGHCPYGNNTFKKGAPLKRSLSLVFEELLWFYKLPSIGTRGQQCFVFTSHLIGMPHGTICAVFLTNTDDSIAIAVRLCSSKILTFRKQLELVSNTSSEVNHKV